MLSHNPLSGGKRIKICIVQWIDSPHKGIAYSRASQIFAPRINSKSMAYNWNHHVCFCNSDSAPDRNEIYRSSNLGMSSVKKEANSNLRFVSNFSWITQ